MLKLLAAFAPATANAVAKALREERIPFRGPVRTQGNHVVFFIGRWILLESELVELHRQGRLNPDGIDEVAHRVEAANVRESQRP